MSLPRLTFHRQSRFLNSLLFVALLACAPAGAQEPDEVVRVRTDLITVPTTVADSHRRRVFDLTQQDFAVRVDNQPVEISHFSVGTSHVALLFLLDASGSAREIIQQQRETALALFSRFGLGSRVAILHFGNFIRLTVPFTSDASGAEAAFTFPPHETSGTAIFDAAAAAVRSFDGSGGFSAERRIVVLISDGLDTLSSTSPTAVVNNARLRGVSFYVIHFPLYTPREGRLAPRPPSKGFRDLANLTGGQYFRIGDARSSLDPRAQYDLSPVFQAIEDDLRSQYVLGFYPAEATRDGQTHSVTVNLSSQKRKLKVNQLRTSYTLTQKPND